MVNIKRMVRIDKNFMIVFKSFKNVIMNARSLQCYDEVNFITKIELINDEGKIRSFVYICEFLKKKLTLLGFHRHIVKRIGIL